MPTTKKRIYISVSDVVDEAVTALAERDGVPPATKAAELIRSALETEEDAYLAQLVAEREADGTKPISHEEVWA